MLQEHCVPDHVVEDIRFLFTLASIALGRNFCDYCGRDTLDPEALERLQRRGWVREVRTPRALYFEVTYLGLERLKGALRGLRVVR